MQISDGLKFVYAIVALLSEGKYDVIISAPNCEIEIENLRPLRAELPAVWSVISNAMRGFKDHSLHMLVLDEMLGLELSHFSRQLKLKPGIDDDHRVIAALSNDLWFRGMEVKEGRERREKSKETRAHMEAMVLRLNHSNSSFGCRCFRARPSNDQEDPCLLGKGGKPGQKCRREVSRVREQSVPSDPGDFRDTESKGRRWL